MNLYSLLVYIERTGNESPKDYTYYISHSSYSSFGYQNNNR